MTFDLTPLFSFEEIEAELISAIEAHINQVQVDIQVLEKQMTNIYGWE